MDHRLFVHEGQLHREDDRAGHDRAEHEREEPSHETATAAGRTTGRSAHELQRGLFVVLFGRHQHLAGLRAVARGDDAFLLELVHDASSAGEADAQLSLQHRRRAGLRANDEFTRLREDLIVVVTRAATGRAAATNGYVERDDVLATPALRAPRFDHARYLVLRDPRRLQTTRDVGRRGHQQHVALADETLRAGLVEDDPAIGERGAREGDAARDVGLDDTG